MKDHNCNKVSFYFLFHLFAWTYPLKGPGEVPIHIGQTKDDVGHDVREEHRKFEELFAFTINFNLCKQCRTINK